MRKDVAAATAAISGLAGPESPGNDEEQTTSARRTVRGVWDTVSSAVGAVLGLAPHVLHHVGFIAGSALVTGAGGTVLFYVLGAVLSLPMLRRLYRRFGTWKAPAIALAIFTAVFAVSNLLIGPAISDSADTPSDQPTQQPADEHSGHHR